MLRIVTVQTGNYCDRGAEYVAKLFDGVRRFMPKGVEYRCECLTDDPTTLPNHVADKLVPAGIAGWWNKLALFSPGMFPSGDRIVYSDLDTIVTGDLSDIAGYRGKFAIMRDPYHPQHVGSSLMSWEAGTLDHIWTTWDRGGRPQFDPRGDQRWIETMQPQGDYWQDFVPGQVASYKVDCWKQGRIPPDTRVLMFHGLPRPHETKAAFIEELWRRPLLLQDVAA